MGYFSNGSEGEGYQERYCYRCENWKPYPALGWTTANGIEGCPIWFAHENFNYEQCNEERAGRKALRQALAILIPEDKKGYNQQCNMFREKPPQLPFSEPQPKGER